MGMTIEQITLREIRMELVHFFETSFGRTTGRQHHPGGGDFGGVSGWGEVTAGRTPSTTRSGPPRPGLFCATTWRRECSAANSIPPPTSPL